MCLDGADYSSSPDQSKSPLGTACPRNWCQGYPFQLPAERNRERKDFESGSRGRQKPLLSQHLTQNPIQQTGRQSWQRGPRWHYILWFRPGFTSHHRHKVLCRVCPKFLPVFFFFLFLFFFVVADFTKLWLGRFWGQRARMSGIQSLVSYGREPPHASLAQVLFS